MPSFDKATFLADELRRNDRDRFVLSLLAPSDKREALFALYGFDREIANLKYVVAEPTLRLIRLQWWRDTLDGLFSGHHSDHPLADALGDVIRQYDLPRWPFDRLIDSRQAELDAARPSGMADFENRAEGIGAPVLSLSLDVLGIHDDDEALRAARHAGIAWGMVSALRSLAADAKAGRETLPSAGSDQNTIETVQSAAEAARAQIALARQRRAQMPKGAIPALLLVSVAEGYLNRLRRARFDAFSPRWRETRPRPALWAWKAWRGTY